MDHCPTTTYHHDNEPTTTITIAPQCHLLPERDSAELLSAVVLDAMSIGDFNVGNMAQHGYREPSPQNPMHRSICDSYARLLNDFDLGQKVISGPCV